MLKLEYITKNAAVTGVEPGGVVRIVTTEQAGSDSLVVYYKTVDGVPRERMLFRFDEANLALAEAGPPGPLIHLVKPSSWPLRRTASTWRVCSIR